MLSSNPIIRTILLIMVIYSAWVSNLHSQNLLTDSQIIGPKGGYLSVEDPATGMTVILNIPEDALRNDTSITLTILTTPLPKPIAKTHIKGISLTPRGLYLREKAEIQILNPPGDITDRMMLYTAVNGQFAVPCATQLVNIGENWISGGIYILSNYCLGTPSKEEITVQSKKLAAYNPAKQLADLGLKSGDYLLLADNSAFNPEASFNLGWKYNLPGIPEYFTDETAPELHAFADEDCMRWQKVLVKVEGILWWAQYAILTGNTQMENQAHNDADKALQDAIDDFMNRPPPANPCVNHVKAAAKYIEAGTKLGLNVGQGSPIDQRFSQLVNQCSYTFAVEFREWIDNPKETQHDGSTYEEKLNRYATINCFVPYTEFSVTGKGSVKGSGIMSLSYDNHWVGDEKNAHETQRGKISSDKIEGTIDHWVDDVGQPHIEAHITIYWKKEVTLRTWGVGAGHEPYDATDIDRAEYKESKVIPLVNGYTEQIGNEWGGMSIRVFNIKSPGDGRENPDDCF
jgi:hypothetical protein